MWTWVVVCHWNVFKSFKKKLFEKSLQFFPQKILYEFAVLFIKIA